MISPNTENQLKQGVWDSWETRRKIPSLKNKEELDEIYINQSDFELIEGMEWVNIKSDKVTKTTPWVCKRSVVMGKECIIIQEVEHDAIYRAKIVTNNIELILWLEDFRNQPRQRVVNIDKEDIREMNALERHGVRFNSTIDKEELDKNGVMITGIDNYDNYWYEIYDTLRNTYNHEKRINIIEADDKTGDFIEKWLEDHHLNNKIEDVLDYWNDDLAYELKWNYSYQYAHPYDKNTYGGILFEGKMKELCNQYDVPITIGWDMWKVFTMKKMKEVLTTINQRYSIYNNESAVKIKVTKGKSKATIHDNLCLSCFTGLIFYRG